MPSGKRRMHSVSGRHDDNRWRNAPGVFRKESETFFFNFRYFDKERAWSCGWSTYRSTITPAGRSCTLYTTYFHMYHSGYGIVAGQHARVPLRQLVVRIHIKICNAAPLFLFSQRREP